MNTHDIIVKAAKASGVSQKATKAVVDAAIAAIIDGLMDGDRITLHGLGTLYTVVRRPKRRFNILTKEVDEQPALCKIKVEEAKRMRAKLCQLSDRIDPAVQPVQAPQSDSAPVPEE